MRMSRPRWGRAGARPSRGAQVSIVSGGERDLARARADIAKAERRISEAVAAKADAQKQIEDGNIQMSRAEADYAVTKAGPSAVTRDD